MPRHATAETMGTNSVRILLAGFSDALDHGLTAMLAGADGFTVQGSRLTHGTLSERLAHQEAEVVVLGEQYAREPETIEEMRAHFPQLGVLLVADGITPATRMRLLAQGAIGCLPTDASELHLIEAVRLASEGSSMHVVTRTQDLRHLHTASLTLQERAVLSAMQRGLPNPEIAVQMSISINTVRSHVKHIYAKLGIKRRAELLTLEPPRFEHGTFARKSSKDHPFGA